MDYTRSQDHTVHESTGQRMHDDTKPIPAVWSGQDANSVMWSLMEVIKSAGMEGKAFNPDDPLTYRVLDEALKLRFAPIDSTGVPDGGLTDMALVKRTDENGDVEWRYVSGVPIGTIEYFAMTTPPPGYLIANGAAVGRLTYPELFAAIGTTFGAGDGSTTFNLPDLRGEFVRGWDAGRNVDAGRAFGSAQGDAIRNMTGSISFSKAGEGMRSLSGVFSDSYTTNATTAGHSTGSAEANPVIDFNAANSGIPTADENRPHNIALLACIKAFDAATNPGLIDITALANEVTGKADRSELVVTTTIYPNGGTATNPANVTVSQRIVINNPFPGYYVHCEAQILYNGNWGNPEFQTNTEPGNIYQGHGVAANQFLDGEAIVIQSGKDALVHYSSTSGNPFNISVGGTILVTAPCRVIITRLGKIQ